jgi:hypothetical protein
MLDMSSLLEEGKAVTQGGAGQNVDFNNVVDANVSVIVGLNNG